MLPVSYSSQTEVPHRAFGTCTASKTLICGSRVKNERKTNTEQAMSARYQHRLQTSGNVQPPTTCELIKITFSSYAALDRVFSPWKGPWRQRDGRRAAWDALPSSPREHCQFPRAAAAGLGGPGAAATPGDRAARARLLLTSLQITGFF